MNIGRIMEIILQIKELEAAKNKIVNSYKFCFTSEQDEVYAAIAEKIDRLKSIEVDVPTKSCPEKATTHE